MKHRTGLIVLAVSVYLGMAIVTYAAGEPIVSRTIKGDVLKIQDNTYIVHDTAGHEVPVHVDKNTQLDGAFMVGDKVEAILTDEGHAISIKHVSSAGGGMAALGPQTIKGDVLKIQGDTYTVHDTAGHEIPVHVDKRTQLDGAFKTGDKVEVVVTDKGHALSIKHISQAK